MSQSHAEPGAPATCAIPNDAQRDVVIPEIEEIAEISTHLIDSGVVRISKQVEEVERTFQPALHEEHVRVERVAVRRIVQKAPEIRTEGDTTIIPVVEEVVVKLILLKEEIRVTRQRVERPSEPRQVTLRREHVKVERLPAGAAPPAQAATH